MTEEARLRKQISAINVGADYGDCEADPVPALWYDDDDLLSESGIIDRFWLPIAVAVLVGWGSLSFVLFTAFGWLVLLAIAGVVAAGTASAVILARTGDKDDMELVPVSDTSDQSQSRFRNAA